MSKNEKADLITWLYVLRCEGDSYYVGLTKDITKRFVQH